MKYLFIVQGEGRGHLTQAITLENMLLEQGHEVVEILVGESSKRILPCFFKCKIKAPIKRFASPNFLPTAANKRVHIGRSILYNMMKVPTYMQSMCYIRQRISDSKADVVVNFYELLTGLTYALFRLQTPYFCIGHQYLFLHRDFEFPAVNQGNIWLLKFFTHLTALRSECKLALSFREMEKDEKAHITVVPPLLRSEVYDLKPAQDPYWLGYMVNAGFAESVKQYHRAHPEIPLHFFWDQQAADEDTVEDATLSFHQVSDTKFLNYMERCCGYATTAGFESVCEAMYLGKPILMVPVHIEQDCNAYDAIRSGAGIVAKDFELDKLQAFARHYQPNTSFSKWVHKAEYRILPQLAPNPEKSQSPTFKANRIALLRWWNQISAMLIGLFDFFS